MTDRDRAKALPARSTTLPPTTRADNGTEAVLGSSEALQLLTADDLAAAWGVRRKQVYNLVEQHGLPCVRLGRYQRFRAEAVEAWLERQEGCN